MRKGFGLLRACPTTKRSSATSSGVAVGAADGANMASAARPEKSRSPSTTRCAPAGCRTATRCPSFGLRGSSSRSRAGYTVTSRFRLAFATLAGFWRATWCVGQLRRGRARLAMLRCRLRRGRTRLATLRFRGGVRRVVGFGLGEFDPENPGDVGLRQRLLPGGGLLSGARHGFLDQFQVIDLAQAKEQLRLLIQTRPDAVQHGGNVLAHAGPVRAGARHLDLAGPREQAAI